MTASRQRTAILLGLVTFAGLGACVKRTERITVLADGSARLHTTIEGDAWDVRKGDALPTDAAGWDVQDKLVTDEDGKEEIERQARRNVGAGQGWPDSYAEAGDWLEDLVLRFPTTLTVERRPDGTYYHFRRVYERRDHACTDYEQTLIMESDDMQELKQKEPEELSDEERLHMAEAFLQAHVRKTASFIDAVIEEFYDEVPQDVLLAMRRRALAVFETEELQERIHRMVLDPENAEDSDDLEAELHEQLTQAVEEELLEAGVPRRAVQAMIMAGMRIGKTYQITEDLGDEEWMVTVHMPGRIIAHNSFDPTLGGELENKTGVENPQEQSMGLIVSIADGERYEFDNEPFQVGWRFKGPALYDRDVVLMATSFVPKE